METTFFLLMSRNSPAYRTTVPHTERTNIYLMIDRDLTEKLKRKMATNKKTKILPTMRKICKGRNERRKKIKPVKEQPT